MSEANFWVGAIRATGSMWLYDPSLPHDDPNMIYVYYVDRDEMREYPKDYVKKMLSTIKDSSRDAAILKYLVWFEKHGVGFVERDRKIKKIEAEERQKRAIERHKEYLLEHGKEYSGITQGSNKKHRVTHCYSCKAGLDSSLHIECNACNWLICYCGACGCGYGKL